MMQLTRDIINLHQETHESIDYYLLLIGQIENNVECSPDIAIESSKSLIEGVCKLILLSLDSTSSVKKFKKMQLPKMFSEACEFLGQHVDLEADFAHRTSSMIARLAELRNERGDISHGKAAPKECVSSVDTAKMVMGVTDSIVTYILTSYFSIDLKFKEMIAYEMNPEFNNFLDETYELEGISYSQALYDQDYDAYEEQLRDYLDSSGELEEVEQE